MWMHNRKTRSEDDGSLLQATRAPQSHLGSEFTEGAPLSYGHIPHMLPGAHCGSGSDGSTSRRSRQWPSGAPRTWRSPTPTPVGLNTTTCKRHAVLARYSCLPHVPPTERHSWWGRHVHAGKWKIPGSKGRERGKAFGCTLAADLLKTSSSYSWKAWLSDCKAKQSCDWERKL